MESNEILAVVDSVSTEKGLEKDVIFKAIEVAIASASQRHFHEDADLYVSINRDTGEYTTHRNWIVFDESDEEYHHETHVSAKESKLSDFTIVRFESSLSINLPLNFLLPS